MPYILLLIGAQGSLIKVLFTHAFSHFTPHFSRHATFDAG
jgi:hypothetical protein